MLKSPSMGNVLYVRHVLMNLRLIRTIIWGGLVRLRGLMMLWAVRQLGEMWIRRMVNGTFLYHVSPSRDKSPARPIVLLCVVVVIRALLWLLASLPSVCGPVLKSKPKCSNKVWIYESYYGQMQIRSADQPWQCCPSALFNGRRIKIISV